MNFIVSATTDIGLTKSTNQDSYNVSVFNTNKGKIVLAVLCDGMGGLSKGEVASASLVKAFREWAAVRLPILLEKEQLDETIFTEWTDISIKFNEKIKNYGKKCGLVNGLGTTLTAMLLTESRYYIINIGDTRAYEITDTVVQLTKDQTVVAREIEQGILTVEEAESDPRRSILLQCVGASDEIYPDVFCGDIRKDAVYILCSDGFRHEITETEIHSCLNPSVMVDTNGMKSNIEKLIELNKQRQERDNISAIAIRTF